MKIYEDRNVLQAFYDRMDFIFDEFEDIVVSVSGGKDSTVIYHLVKEMAEEKGRLPIKVQWIDQEAEWQATVDISKKWLTADGVDPYWFQIPMVMTNAASDEYDFLKIWNPDQKDIWMRDKHPISIKENTYGTKRFSELFGSIAAAEYSDKKTAIIAGVRTEESYNRYLGLTQSNTYKGITWGRKYGSTDKAITFYPIYDWHYADVWKTIHDNDWDYNDVYDEQFKLGLSLREMRISNLNHETSIKDAFYMQKIEPETHDKLVKRLPGIDAASKAGFENYHPDELPFMFKDWREYRNFLLEKLVDDPEHKKGFKKHFLRHDLEFEHETGTLLGTSRGAFTTNDKEEGLYQKICREHIRAILANDWEGDSILANTHSRYSSKQTRAIYEKKVEYLKEIGVWNKLAEQGIVNEEG